MIFVLLYPQKKNTQILLDIYSIEMSIISNNEVKKEHKRNGHLEMKAVDAAANLAEQRNHTSAKLLFLSGLQNLLQLGEKHDLLRAIADGPVLQQAPNHRLRELHILLHELGDAIRELLVVRRDAPGLV